MKPLIDADILRYELGFSGEWMDEGEPVTAEWEFVAQLLRDKVESICEGAGGTEPPLLFLTNDTVTHKIHNRWLATNCEEPWLRVVNFRDAVATVKPYKGTRKSAKPFHYSNITAYIMSEWDFVLANGVEADDLMAMRQTEETIICSRDKDLRQVPGWHYSWRCGKQEPIGPIEFNKKGFIESRDGKIFGGGEMFFLFQLLMGDAVDNIPGCPKIGPAKAFKILEGCETREQCYTAVREAYRAFYKENELTYLTEQAKLLHLLRGEDDEWSWPYED